MEKIANGVFGEVYLVKSGIKGEEVLACKRIEKSKHKNEIEILKKLNHENILKFYYFREDLNFLYIYTEYIQGNNLEFYITSKLEKKEIWKSIYPQIVNGINYLHSKDIVHCDLKLSNIMYNKPHIKIIDFGNAREKSSLNCNCCPFLGTFTYTAPEILKREELKDLKREDLKRKELNEKIDFWSLGICLFVLLTKEYPFQGNTLKALSLRIQSQEIDYSEYNLEKKEIKILKSLLNKKPKKRLYISYV